MNIFKKKNTYKYVERRIEIIKMSFDLNHNSRYVMTYMVLRDDKNKIIFFC